MIKYFKKILDKKKLVGVTIFFLSAIFMLPISSASALTNEQFINFNYDVISIPDNYVYQFNKVVNYLKKTYPDKHSVVSFKFNYSDTDSSVVIPTHIGVLIADDFIKVRPRLKYDYWSGYVLNCYDTEFDYLMKQSPLNEFDFNDIGSNFTTVSTCNNYDIGLAFNILNIALPNNSIKNLPYNYFLSSIIDNYFTRTLFYYTSHDLLYYGKGNDWFIPTKFNDGNISDKFIPYYNYYNEGLVSYDTSQFEHILPYRVSDYEEGEVIDYMEFQFVPYAKQGKPIQEINDIIVGGNTFFIEQSYHYPFEIDDILNYEVYEKDIDNEYSKWQKKGDYLTSDTVLKFEKWQDPEFKEHYDIVIKNNELNGKTKKYKVKINFKDNVIVKSFDVFSYRPKDYNVIFDGSCKGLSCVPRNYRNNIPKDFYPTSARVVPKNELLFGLETLFIPGDVDYVLLYSNDLINSQKVVIKNEHFSSKLKIYDYDITQKNIINDSNYIDKNDDYYLYEKVLNKNNLWYLEVLDKNYNYDYHAGYYIYISSGIDYKFIYNNVENDNKIIINDEEFIFNEPPFNSERYELDKSISDNVNHLKKGINSFNTLYSTFYNNLSIEFKIVHNIFFTLLFALIVWKVITL